MSYLDLHLSYMCTVIFSITISRIIFQSNVYKMYISQIQHEGYEKVVNV